MKVLIGNNLMGLEKAIPELQAAFPDVTFEYCERREDLSDAIVDANVYMGWLGREIFLAAEDLQWIQSPSSGVNHYLAIPELVESDVLLTSAVGTHSVCLAESVMAMILAFTRGIKAGLEAQHQHRWAGREIRRTLVELTGGTIGIVGFGSVGRAVAKRAAAFDMRVLAVDLYTDDPPDTLEALWPNDRLHEMLSQSDYVVVTVPWTPKTEGMIGPEEIAAMKEGAILVGISRGGVIDQDAMADALRRGHLKAAGLDVFKPEPLPEDSELWDMDNLIITPHAAGGTQYEGERVLEIFRENLERFLHDDLPLRNQVDKTRGF
jgi:phosphoglycerate dehydrogenase-like enzyme